MPPPTNKFSVTVADAHSHSYAESAVEASSKIDAALSVLNALQNSMSLTGGPLAGLTIADAWTITITQP